MTSGRLFADIDDARSLAQAIVDTVREPLLVLDKELRVVAASRSFYLTFRANLPTPGKVDTARAGCGHEKW